MQKIKKYIPAILFLTPFFTLAAVVTIDSLISRVLGILYYVVELLIAVAVVMFLYGVVKYITAGGDEEKRKEGKNMMIWGIVGLFVMIAVWGLVNVLLDTFSLDVTRPDYPEL